MQKAFPALPIVGEEEGRLVGRGVSGSARAASQPHRSHCPAPPSPGPLLEKGDPVQVLDVDKRDARVDEARIPEALRQGRAEDFCLWVRGNLCARGRERQTLSALR